jgi:hypothetical protein
VDDAHWTKQIERYVSTSAMPLLNEQKDSECANIAIRAKCLNFWLQLASGVRYNNYAEARHV